ncbi:sugar MFS transporter [Alteromonas sp. ASW11-36]|uniref:Sugar MFS transporter n=1 Tax=Alteromonas arenosi TaxID=3055817 RepID=A0ABT7SSC3_9ALTE|nr:sugar MFS transporter [Alteromonas sp. ASW11-36]MDM7859093.1 sugar MFS transporter [Alteromonas sp. ASW11-36]
MTTKPITASSQSSLVPMLIIGGLFFIFGFITWLNGALIPFLQIVCDLTETEALLVAFSFYIAYTVMALPMSWVLDKTGYKWAMVIGLLIIAAGCLLFIPAAYSQTFAIFLIAQFVVGSGLTILQTASNPYIVKIGPHETAAVRISVMGFLNKAAGFIAPIVFTALVLGEFAGVTAQSVAQLSDTARADKVAQLADGLVMPYLGMAVALVLLAGLLKISSLPELDLSNEQSQDGQSQSLLAYPQLILGALTLFVYVGVEVVAGDTIGLFGSQLGVENATSLTSYTMAFMVLGYLIGLAVIPRFVSQSKALAMSAWLGLVLSLLVVFSAPDSYMIANLLWGWMGIPTVPDTVAYIALLGLANALVWPAVWPLALDGLGKLTARGSALLIMGIAGGAIIPLIYGVLSETIGGQSAYWMLLPCYGFILFYAYFGHQMRQWRRS